MLLHGAGYGPIGGVCWWVMVVVVLGDRGGAEC